MKIIKLIDPLAQGVLVPNTLSNDLVLEHGVCYGQTMNSTAVQQWQLTAWVTIRQAIPPSHSTPGFLVSANMIPTFSNVVNYSAPLLGADVHTTVSDPLIHQEKLQLWSTAQPQLLPNRRETILHRGVWLWSQRCVSRWSQLHLVGISLNSSSLPPQKATVHLKHSGILSLHEHVRLRKETFSIFTKDPEMCHSSTELREPLTEHIIQSSYPIPRTLT